MQYRLPTAAAKLELRVGRHQHMHHVPAPAESFAQCFDERGAAVGFVQRVRRCQMENVHFGGVARLITLSPRPATEPAVADLAAG